MSVEAERGAEVAVAAGFRGGEEGVQPKKQAGMDTENLCSSQPAGTKLLPQPAEEMVPASSAGICSVFTFWTTENFFSRFWFLVYSSMVQHIAKRKRMLTHLST